MPEEKSELREINYKQLFPWIELFRGFRIALDLKKLALAAAGLVVMVAGWRVLSLPFGGLSEDGRAAGKMVDGAAAQAQMADSYRQWPWQRPLQYGTADPLDQPAEL